MKERTRWMAVYRITPTVLLLCVFILTTSVRGAIAQTNSSDVSALKELAKAWSSTSFLNWVGDPCADSWTGIVCDSTNKSVTSLFLENQNLNGFLPSAVGGLTQLTSLELSRNPNLGGEVPEELGRLVKLIYLSLQWCNFSGPIPPSLGNLTQATLIGLNGNRLTGSIPSTFGNLINVTWLDISANQLSGPIPVSSSPGSGGIGLDNMTRVRHFHFNDNHLDGSIPPELFFPKDLLHVIVDHNDLVNELPKEVGNANNLTVLRVDNNKLSGNLPAELGRTAKLVIMHLDNNTFSGPLPDLSNLTNIQLLDVSGNRLFDPQPVPSWLSKSSKLQTLSLAQSNFVGKVPFDIFNLPELQSMNLSQNQFNETLDFEGTTGTALEVVDLRNNSITGFSDQRGADEQPLISLLLEGNPLCSSEFLVVRGLGCGNESVINAWSRPDNFSCNGVRCRSGKILNPKTCNCSYPFQLSLVLTAPQFTNLTLNLAQVIEGLIANGLTGTVPEPLLRLLGQQMIDPSQVVIASGSLLSDARYNLSLQFFPQSSTGDTLPSLVTSAITNVLNQRQFNIPEGPFQVPSVRGLAGYEKYHKSPLGTAAIAGIVAGVAVFALVLSMYAVRQKRLADRLAKSHDPFASWGAGGGEVGEAPRLKGSRWVSLAELKIATDDWSERNEIGEGAYGKVYRGVLKTGTLVAIKRARQGNLKAAGEFKDEIETLSRVHHRNLVGLIGFCFQDGEQALVFEFESTATLRDHLQGTTESPLSWQDRLDIAVGAARALAYLHDQADPPIIHGNMKSSNILLNERKVAKVSDFSLSELTGPNVNEGTGYLDPEYYNTHRLTAKSDVYSFGVVLFELLTAEDPVVDGRFIVHDFRQALERGGWKEVRRLLDPRIHSVSNKELEALLRIAFMCVEESSANRQDTATTVKHLEALGGHSYPNSGVENLEVDIGGPKTQHDKSNVIERPLRSSVQTDDDDFEYSGDFGSSNILRRSISAISSRLQSPKAHHPFIPLSPRDEQL